MRKLFYWAVCLFVVCTSLVLAEEQKTRTVIYTDVAGDMFHAGHVEFLKKARAFGDYLIVGVLADDVIKSYKRQPILTLEERVKMFESCKYVDEVIVAPPLRLTEEMIKDLQITYVVRGDDFNKELLEDQYGLALKLGILRMVPYTQGISTTNIIQRIIERYKQGEFGGKSP